jgi:hypothetical protein
MQEGGVLRALYYLVFSIGGVGFSVPMGLLIAGISVPSVIMKLLPKWLAISGLVLAMIGELSALTLVISVSHSGDAIPEFYLVDIRWIQTAGERGGSV